MSTKVIVVKVNITCGKCRTDVNETISKLQGVSEVTLNDEKGTVTVVGTVDPVAIVTQLRKVKKYGEIISVGLLKKPEPKPEPVKPVSEPQPLPPCCQHCQFRAFTSSYDNTSCSIL